MSSVHSPSFLFTSPMSKLILQPFLCFTYVTAHSPTLLLLDLHHSSFSNTSFASPTSQALHLCHLASRPCHKESFHCTCKRTYSRHFKTAFFWCLFETSRSFKLLLFKSSKKKGKVFKTTSHKLSLQFVADRTVHCVPLISIIKKIVITSELIRIYRWSQLLQRVKTGIYIKLHKPQHGFH